MKEDLRSEFSKATANYYAGQLTEINHKDASTFFLKINRFLRKKNNTKIGDQVLSRTDPIIKKLKIETCDNEGKITRLLTQCQN